MLDGIVIRKRVDAIKLKIEEAEADLECLREKCTHGKTHIKHIKGAQMVICDYCDMLVAVYPGEKSG